METSRRVSETDSAVGARIHQIAWRQGVTNLDIGRAIGINSSAGMSRKMHGIRGWSLAEVILASRLLEVPVADLLDGPELVECAIRDSNPEPADYAYALLDAVSAA